MEQKQRRPGFDWKMGREEISALPIKSCTLPIKVIRTRRELSSAFHDLLREKVLGFDTETKPSFTKGEVYPPALLQLAGSKVVYLFQLSILKLPSILRELLSNPHIIKAGIALERDIKELKHLGEFEPAGFVDLGKVAKRSGIKNHGLRGLAGVFLGFGISKHAQRSNWARKNLSPEQVRYAATDAWTSRKLYLRMKQEGYL